MRRREAIKQLFILAGGIMIATSCQPGKASISLNYINLSKADEDLLAECVEAILPETDTPGAKSLRLHLFVMKMLDDCHSPEEQKLFIKGLQRAHEKVGKSPAQIQQYLYSLGETEVFFRILKQRTLMGYQNSEYVMKNKLIYELVPARYKGALKINT